MNKSIKIILGITGSIAAYKSPDIIRRLQERNAIVTAAMTQAGTRFITPLTIQAVTGQNVFLDPVSSPASFSSSEKIVHTDITSEADAMIIAPATANIIAKITYGMADDAVSLSALALKQNAPLIIAPAMNPRMWNAEATQRNITILQSRGITIAGPEEGYMACGDFGFGRMSEADKIISYLFRAISIKNRDFGLQTIENKRKKILILSGPTREYIDDVRFISNGSSGRMGNALARAAFESGYDVTVISGQSEIKIDSWINQINVTTAEEMLEAGLKRDFDILISPAAIADYKPAERKSGKPEKKAEMNLNLIQTSDVFTNLISKAKAKNKNVIGIAFAAEENFDDIEKIIVKGQRKGADAILLNEAKASIGDKSVKVKFINIASKNVIEFDYKDKYKAAEEIISCIGISLIAQSKIKNSQS